MKYFIKLVLIATIIVITLFTSSAQSNFVDGFFINQKGDSVHSAIKYYTGNNSYHICEVLTEDGDIITYTPQDIQAYGYKDDVSFSSNVIDSLFLQNIILGTISLYEKQSIYYISTKDTIYQIENSSELQERNGRTYLVNQNVWKGELYYLAKDNGQLKELIDQIHFRRKDLIKFVIELNNEIGSNYRNVGIQTNLDKFDWGLRVGQQFNKLSKNSSGNYPDINDVYRSQSQTISFFAVFNVPEFSKSLSFNTELLLSKITYSGTTIDARTSPKNEYETNFRYFQLSTPIYVTYRLNQNSLFLNLLAGANTQFNLNGEYITKRTSIIGTYREESTQQPFIPYSFQPGFLLGFSLGLELNELEIGVDTRYIRFSKLNKELNLFINQQHVNIGFYVKF